MNLDIYQVDAFSSKLFGGNPAAVIPLKNWLPDEVLQNIAAENNLSETAFFTAETDHFKLRWFTPVFEVDLCGHATIASAHVLWKELNYPKNEIKFNSKSGLLGVTNKEGLYTLDFPTDHLEEIDSLPLIEQALGISPVSMFKGREDYLVILNYQQELEKLDPDFRQLSLLKSRGVIASAPGREVDFVSRCFFPYYGIDEDPVTGSAHTTLTPYWAKKLGKASLTARQISKRGGELKVELRGQRTAISGRAVTYLKGEIYIP